MLRIATLLLLPLAASAQTTVKVQVTQQAPIAQSSPRVYAPSVVLAPVAYAPVYVPVYVPVAPVRTPWYLGKWLSGRRGQ